VIDRPVSIPAGLRIDLSRQRLLPGASAEADRWMEMLALEVVFRREDEDGEWLYWVSIYGEGGAGLDEMIPIDRDHLAFAKRCKHPGWQEAIPQFFLSPDTVREAILGASQIGS
jgi:hypothetical protein